MGEDNGYDWIEDASDRQEDGHREIISYTCGLDAYYDCFRRDHQMHKSSMICEGTPENASQQRSDGSQFDDPN
jgi:hypothetical protein